MKEFVKFVEQLFPSIEPYIAQNVKDVLIQFEKTGNTYTCFINKPLDYLAQGDILEELPFYKIDDDGALLEYKTKGLLLSNTCDAANDDNILCAPMLPLVKLEVERSTVKKNQIYNLLYFPDNIFSEYVVDLSLINTFSKFVIKKALEKNIIKKTASLSTFGYYLFLSKMTIHFMRPEDLTVQEERSSV